MGTAYDRIREKVDSLTEHHRREWEKLKKENGQANEPTALEVIMSVRVILLENGHKTNKMLDVLREYLNRTEKELMNEREQASVDMELGEWMEVDLDQMKELDRVMEKNWRAKGINLKEFDEAIECLRNLYQDQPSENGRQMITLSIENLINMSEKRITNHLNQTVTETESDQDKLPEDKIVITPDSMLNDINKALSNKDLQSTDIVGWLESYVYGMRRNLNAEIAEQKQNICDSTCIYSKNEQKGKITKECEVHHARRIEQSTHKGRMISERNQLSVRYGKLNDFICSDEYDKLPSDERLELNEQRHHMACYLKVLDRRVARLDRL